MPSHSGSSFDTVMTFTQLPRIAIGSASFRSVLLEMELEKEESSCTYTDNSDTDCETRSRNNTMFRGTKASKPHSMISQGHRLRPAVLSIMTISKFRRLKQGV
ncbi:hypothetical protein DPMN_081229 [Dreissena polymorpha]|uniref:Uncharacterized protein n=1 Tax=Dreissena polymorpha TaxID=45954 RepID=A0A9D4BGB9_DREPO|nr:hypothetical protein DPMN_081229 [Dreissena polymorpha]